MQSANDNNGVNDLFELQSGLGYAAFDAPTLSVAENAGSLSINVNRVRGQATVGVLSASITNGTAMQTAKANAMSMRLPWFGAFLMRVQALMPKPFPIRLR